jgi:Domain of unknown function (DUF4835)
MKLKLLFTLALFVCLLNRANAQEFDFDIKVQPPAITQLADPKIFKSLEAALKELVNNTRWTEDIYEQQERLQGSIRLTIKSEASVTGFTAELAIQANRPVHGTDYTTPIFIHLDREVSFTYEQFQPVQFVKNNFTDNLSSTIAYYLYIILGMDYDSFSPQGGEPYWQLAQDIFNTLPSAAKSEWQGKDLGNRNRYWFVENMLSPRLKNYRQGVYEYHRLGLDVASTDANRCKAAIFQCLDKMDEAQQAYPNTLAVRTFAGTKTSELIEIFKNSSSDQKSKFIQIMTRIDPANASKFNQVGF